MKKLNTVQIIAIVVSVAGAIMVILNATIEDITYKEVLAFDQLVFWSGILLWGFGGMLAHKRKSKTIEED
ncbi:hypothetical protein PXD56_10590 [Maribacter sp. SA7]|uniref:hypothetical protein n=1 Tax=Maribacter zhoushanensis TaxID=3030012 RepID=UPI0023EDBDFF|nr:hypothetical protein [Maribacter zhoushanensis]MDF4203405.1 hypothetical protein [Maribacter zhoushanensis]